MEQSIRLDSTMKRLPNDKRKFQEMMPTRPVKKVPSTNLVLV